ncbi:MAG: SOS response-associated peptidase [Gammaproteobacteria bacterium]
MCGRFALVASESEIVNHFHLKTAFSMRPRYNIAPGATIPAVLPGGRVEFFEWGFTPSWRKVEEGKLPQRFINARIESILDKPTFKQAFKTRRCLVPGSGYFEWKQIHDRKQPFYIFSEQQPLLGLAAIWEMWRAPEGHHLETLAIITKTADENLQAVHDRMPVVIAKEDYAHWLDPKANTDALIELSNKTLVKFKFHPVPTAVNNPRFDQAACIESL